MKNYTLKEYADLLSSVDMLAEAEMMGRDETVITYLTYDSRAVTPVTLFICKGAVSGKCDPGRCGGLCF